MPILDGQDPFAVERAAQALAEGALVALPTETVYGLGARADDEAAVAQIFAAKGRPADHPLIVHVTDASAVPVFAADVPPLAQRLMDAVWPGPLTLILPRRAGMAAAAAGGQDSIGLRCPAHPVAQALLRSAAARGVRGVAAPSANRFGRVSPTTAEHVRQEFGEDLLVLDGGPCAVGIESTIVDCTRGRPVLLRPGVLTREALEAATGQALVDRDAAAPRASGTLASHYAPTARVRLFSSVALPGAVAAWLAAAPAAREPQRLALYFRGDAGRGLSASTAEGLLLQPMSMEAAAAAHDLFADLRHLDAQGVEEIWVEAPPESAAWEGVTDRLRRAATPAD